MRAHAADELTVRRLGSLHAGQPSVLSLYLTAPLEAAALPGLAAHARRLTATAELVAGASGCLREADRIWVQEQVAACGRDWRRRTVAIFACADLGLHRAFPLPCHLRERAVLGHRPHIRPLLAALQCAGQRPENFAVPPGRAAAAGLPACLATVNAGAVQALIVPEDGLVPGYECGRCGALSLDRESCPDWGTAALPVPDVMDEMVARALEDGAQVSVVYDARAGVTARLHLPLALAA